MPADQVPYIFDKFYQVGQHARTAGAGLGLAIAREIVEEHGGTISCDSQQNRGTTFKIALPTDRRTAPRVENEVVEKTA
jgi:two-component system, OmpR family, sensor histidine kinase ArlS